MSVLIKDIRIPESCLECRFCVNGFTDNAPMYECACQSYDNVSVLVDDHGKPFDFRPDWCPLVEEIWREVKGFEGCYSVSNKGRIINNRSGKILNPSQNNEGYLYVVLSKNNYKKHKRVHRLVAEAFIDNPFKKPHVNHIDHDKTNNVVTNLEWVTPQENTDHEIRHNGYATRTSQLRSNKNYRKNKVQLTFLVTKEENEKLLEISKRTGVSRTRIIRKTLTDYLMAEGDDT